jgi:hypothetical protein
MAYHVNQAVHADKVVLEELRLAFYTSINDYPPLGENAEIRIRELRYAVDQLAIYAVSWILDGHKVDRSEKDTIQFPVTPWDFWKQEHAPKWFLKRFPVKFKDTTVTTAIHKHFVCPHINMKDDRFPHIAWMYENSGQKERNEG